MVFLIPIVALASVIGGALVLARWGELSEAEKIRYDQQFRLWIRDTYQEALTTRAMAEQFAREHPEAVELFEEEYRLSSGY
jgi:hypothetical protein